MKKQGIGLILIVSLLAFVLLLSTVHAAGSSTRDSREDDETDDSGQDSERDIAERTLTTNCTSIDDSRGRIKCRLEKRSEAEKDYITEESCKGLEGRKPERCRELYRSSEKCYILNGSEKVSCLREKANYIKENKPSSEAKRDYLVLLLYELQKRVEERFESGRITAEDSAAIIDQIVITKKAIIAGESRDQIKTELQKLRQLWAKAQPRQ